MFSNEFSWHRKPTKFIEDGFINAETSAIGKIFLVYFDFIPQILLRRKRFQIQNLHNLSSKL